MVKRYRSRIRIYYEILEVVCSEGRALPTRILYQANLSHERLQRYLGELKKVGAIKEIAEGGKRTYEITPKGLKLLKKLRDMLDFLEALGLPS